MQGMSGNIYMLISWFLGIWGAALAWHGNTVMWEVTREVMREVMQEAKRLSSECQASVKRMLSDCQATVKRGLHIH